MNKSRINVSAINQYARCPYRWWAQYVMDWVPVEEAEPLAFGRLLHEVFELNANGKSMDNALKIIKTKWTDLALNTNDSFENMFRTKAVLKLHELWEALEQWEDHYEWEVPVLEAECPFELDYNDDLTFVGTPDRVGVMDGRIWHIQNRGLNSSTNFGVYIGLARRHYHEHVYAEALSRKYSPRPYGGTLFNLVRKLKYRTGITKNKPEGIVKTLDQMFFQHPMSIDLESPLHKHVMKSVEQWAYKMRQAQVLYELTGEIPAPNEGANGGMWGNSPDVYYRVLVGEIELGDPRYFKKREQRYAVIEGEGFE